LLPVFYCLSLTFHLAADMPPAKLLFPRLAYLPVLVKEEKLEHMEKMQREREVHEQIMAERAEERFRKHYNVCRGVVEHIVDLVTKIAEYRELTLKYVECQGAAKNPVAHCDKWPYWGRRLMVGGG
ncbi:hypothetical protein scyTo_0022872, partial [Scyliorhinus torazame]|nr:hypothetical protein [Scyliorhinus torazame]